MNSLTVSKSGTAFIHDMMAQGKSAEAGWSSSPNAAYYASLDGNAPVATPAVKLPGSLAELMKLQKSAEEEKNGDLADLIQNEMAKVASQHGMAPSGNIINVKA
jgi:hypothetical protein